VLIGQAAGGLIFAAVAMVLSARVLRKAEAGLCPGTAHPYQRQTRLISLFHNRR
jgi:hypothetical protein